MVALSEHPFVARCQGAFEQLTASFANIVFSRRRAVGLLILAAAATEPRCLGFALCALLAAKATVRGLRLTNLYAPYDYNAVLCGIAIAREFSATPSAFALVLALGASSVLVTAALGALSGYVGFIPVLSIPFGLTSWLSFGVSQRFAVDRCAAWRRCLGLAAAAAARAHAAKSRGLSAVAERARRRARARRFVAPQSNLDAARDERRAAGPAAAAPRAGAARRRHAARHRLQRRTRGSHGRRRLAGPVARLPSLVALGSALLAAFFALGFAGPLTRLGLSLSFVPFNAAAILVLSALRERASNHGPRLADFAADTPEQLLLNHIAEQPHAAVALRLQMPFYGAWMCTQGVDGAYTHRGILRHAYDFELYGGSDNALCGGAGTRLEDYHCFGQPVLAAADGTVVAVETFVPNNAIGEDNPQKPWGNYVTLQHTGAVYSLVAHLTPGSVVVYPGQFVARGTVLGYCGNSGRSPRPHLHFQLQTTALPGSATLPCRFSDVVVHSRAGRRFESAHDAALGEALQTLQPDYALGAHFDLPLGATLTYRIGGKLERVVSEIDGWGSLLAALGRQASAAGFHAQRDLLQLPRAAGVGAPDSVLTLLRLALSHVPLERHPELTFRSALSDRWLGGRLRGLLWDLKAPFKSEHGVALHSRIEIDERGLAVVGASSARGANGAPLIQTRAVFGGAVGPRLLEASKRLRLRTRRAELIVHSPAPRKGRESSQVGPQPRLFPIGVGDW